MIYEKKENMKEYFIILKKVIDNEQTGINTQKIQYFLTISLNVKNNLLYNVLEVIQEHVFFKYHNELGHVEEDKVVEVIGKSYIVDFREFLES